MTHLIHAVAAWLALRAGRQAGLRATRVALVVLAAVLAMPAMAARYNGTTGWGNTNATTATLTQANTPTVTITLPGNSSSLYFRNPPAANPMNDRGGVPAMFAPSTMLANTQFITVTPVISGCTMGSGQVCPRGSMTISFSQPVTNPSIHLTGFGANGSGADFSTRLTLAGSAPAGATLGALSAGAANMQITGGNTIGVINNNGQTDCVLGSNSGSGCASVRINGTVTSLTFNVAVAFANGSGTAGNSRESFDVNVTFPEDFSDAPSASFNTTQAPTHVTSDLRLGSTVDEDNANVMNATTSPFPVAAGADNNGTNGDGADEDAITSFPALTTNSTSYSLTVPISGASKPGMVCGWIDFNRNNAFVASERACASFASGATSVVLNWNAGNGNAPTGLTVGNNYVRLRAGYTTAQVQTADGKGRADSGEVEDYRLTITAPPSATLQLRKVWDDALLDDSVSIPATTGFTNNTSTLNSTVTAPDQTSNGAAVTVFVGNTGTLPAEAMGVANDGVYISTLSCSGGTLSGTNATQPNTLTINPADANTAIVCTYANTRTLEAGTCSASAIYSLDQLTGRIYRVDVASGVETAIGQFDGLDAQLYNALALSSDGRYFYAAQNTPTGAVGNRLYRYDSQTGATGIIYNNASMQFAQNTLMGAVNPVNGNYYYANASGRLYVFDVVAGTTVQVGDFSASGSVSAADMAFDGKGNLYLVLNNALNVIPGPLPTSGTGNLPARQITGALPAGGHSLAFGSDGYLYIITSATLGLSPRTLRRINPATGAQVSSIALTEDGAAEQSVSDAASCAIPTTLTVKKNIVERVVATDQFAVSVTGGGLANGNTGTTAGSDTGLQDTLGEKAGPVIALPSTTYTFTETGAGNPVANLGSYSTTYECVNEAPGAGNAVVVPAATGTSFTYAPPANANIVCTFTNALQQADIQVVKTATPDPVVNGNVVTYQIVVGNNGPQAVSNAVLTDVAGAGQDCTTPSTTATCAATGGASCPSPTVPVSSLLGAGITLPSLPVGGQVTVTLQCTVSASGLP